MGVVDWHTTPSDLPVAILESHRKKIYCCRSFYRAVISSATDVITFSTSQNFESTIYCQTYLQVFVVYLQNICDVERPVLGTAWFVHDLCVQITCWRHDDDNVLPLFIEKECSITDLGTWKQEVVHWTQGIHWQVVYLWSNRDIYIKTSSIFPIMQKSVWCSHHV